MYRKTVTDNGIRVISEEIGHVRSVSIGVWVDCGSRNEAPANNGAAHFIEHMLFKGTGKRSAFDIASEIDSVGGVLNAATGKELTSFYVKIPDYHLPLAIDLLADLLSHSLFDPLEMEKEKAVVFQEIHMVEDTPDDFIHDIFGRIFWHGHPLGFPVLGTEESVTGFQRNTLMDFFKGRYRSDRIVLTAAGNLKHEELVRLVTQSFGSLERSAGEKDGGVPVTTSKIGLMEKDLEQVHIIIGSLAHPFSSPARYAGFIMNAVLGGSMSSRLFQEIREKRGLAYSIHSYLVSYRDAGMFGIYVGTGDDKVRDVIEIIFNELNRLKTDVFTDKELLSAKEQMKGNFLLSMESTDNRMTRLAKNEIYFGRHLPPEETVAGIEAVSGEEIRQLAGEIFNADKISLAALGKVSDHVITKDMMRF